MVKAKKSVSVSKSSSVSRPKSMGLCQYAVAYTLAIIMSVKVLILSIFARTGISAGAGEVLDKVLISWNPSVSGILTGMAEAAICGLIIGFTGAWLYNKFV